MLLPENRKPTIVPSVPSAIVSLLPTLETEMPEFLNSMTQTYSEQTWKQRASVRKAFQRWCEEKSLPMIPLYSNLFIYSNPEWKGSTRRQYLRTLQSIFNAGSLGAQHLKGLARATAHEPVNHAVPMTPVDMVALIRLASDPYDRTVLRLAWSTASRWGEIQKLTTDHFKPREDGKIILDWKNLPKKNQEDINRDDRFTLLSGPLTVLIRQLVKVKGPGALITTMSEEEGLTNLLLQLGRRVGGDGEPKF